MTLKEEKNFIFLRGKILTYFKVDASAKNASFFLSALLSITEINRRMKQRTRLSNFATNYHKNYVTIGHIKLYRK